MPSGFTVDSYFEKVVRQGFADRMPHWKALEARGELRHTMAEYEERLAFEIDVIRCMRYPGYFLIVWDFIRYAREQEIPVGPGPRLGGRQPGGVYAANYGRRSAAFRPGTSNGS